MNLLSFALGAGLANAIAEDEKNKMRNATPEEVKSVNDYIDDISQKVLTVPIPDNATNGDVVKAVFPKARIYEDKSETMVCFDGLVKRCYYPLSWWNASYKAESEE